MSDNIASRAMGWFGFGQDSNQAYPTQAAAPAASRANVTRLPARSVRRAAGDISEIVTFQPKSYKEAASIAAVFREGIPVIINMSDLNDVDASHMVHFIAGLKEGLDGNIKRVTAKVFVLGPTHVSVSDEDEELGDSASDDLIIRP